MFRLGTNDEVGTNGVTCMCRASKREGVWGNPKGFSQKGDRRSLAVPFTEWGTLCGGTGYDGSKVLSAVMFKFRCL